MNQNVPFLPYGRQWISEEDIKAVSDVLRSDFLTQGPAVEQFERDICSLTGAKYCVAVANATAALHIAVAALDIPAGSEGITSPITFVASSNALVYNTIKPVFADIDPRTYCVSPEQIKRKITGKTRILIPVHFAGQPADMESIQAIASTHGCKIIEDADRKSVV